MNSYDLLRCSVCNRPYCQPASCEFLKVTTVKITVFQDVMSCSLVQIYSTEKIKIIKKWRTYALHLFELAKTHSEYGNGDVYDFSSKSNTKICETETQSMNSYKHA